MSHQWTPGHNRDSKLVRGAAEAEVVDGVVAVMAAGEAVAVAEAEAEAEAEAVSTMTGVTQVTPAMAPP